MTDVVVVGAGPAGAATALTLARRGAAVTLLERARFPRTKVCGEYLNAGALAALDELGIGDAVRAFGRPLGGVRLVPPHVDAVDLDFAEPALAIPRIVLDKMIADAAVAAGATLVRGHAEDVLLSGGRVCGVAARDVEGALVEISARAVVGADGAGSLVARKLGLARLPRGRRRFALGGHFRGFGDLGGRVEMYVGARAYFALNPLPEDLVNVMVIVDNVELAAWSRDVDFGIRGKAAQLARGRRSFERTERVGPRVSIGPLGFEVTSLARPGVLLAGDASGFLNPFTGQGVTLALRGGLDAGATVAAALADPARERSLFDAYERRRRRDFAARRRVASVVDTLVDFPFLAKRVSARLRRFPELGERLMSTLGGRDAAQPALSLGLLTRLIV
jgi:2-polyprenyl-6-methoxyphenol hydroxylase-like FAD-dependent oxidoreductase